jgi:putative hemolysin
MTGLIVISILVCLVFSFFFSGSETGIISVNRYRLRGLADQGEPQAVDLLDLLDQKQRLLIMTLLGTNLANVLTALFFKKFIVDHWPDLSGKTVVGIFQASEILSLLILTPVIIILAEILPKAIFRAHADRLLEVLKPLYSLFLRIFWLPVTLIEKFAGLVPASLIEQRTSLARRLTREDVINLVNTDENGSQINPDQVPESSSEKHDSRETPAGLHTQNVMEDMDGLVSVAADERRMVQNILELDSTCAREIMIPLVDLVAIQLGRVDLEGFKAIAQASGYTRFPVYRDRIVEFIGYIDIFNMLRNEKKGDRLEDFVEYACYVPETMKVDDLLQEFLSKRIRNVIVVDEYGGCSGWIAREDILEEIVGELEDELDAPMPQIQEISRGIFVVDGRVEIDTVNEALNTSFEQDDCETISGLVMVETGRMPVEGDKFITGEWEFTVLEMDGHRVSRVRISPVS